MASAKRPLLRQLLFLQRVPNLRNIGFIVGADSPFVVAAAARSHRHSGWARAHRNGAWGHAAVDVLSRDGRRLSRVNPAPHDRCRLQLCGGRAPSLGEEQLCGSPAQHADLVVVVIGGVVAAAAVCGRHHSSAPVRPAPSQRRSPNPASRCATTPGNRPCSAGRAARAGQGPRARPLVGPSDSCRLRISARKPQWPCHASCRCAVGCLRANGWAAGHWRDDPTATLACQDPTSRRLPGEVAQNSRREAHRRCGTVPGLEGRDHADDAQAASLRLVCTMPRTEAPYARAE